MPDTRTRAVIVRSLVGLAALSGGVLLSAGPAGATKVAAPPAPTGVVAQPGPASAAVTWNAVTAPAGETITGYQVKPSKGKLLKLTASTTSCTVAALKDGTAYTIEVRAIAGSKKGAYSAPVSVEAGLPLPPTQVTAAAGPSEATVSFEAGADNGFPVTGYTVTATDTTDPADGGQSASGTTGPLVVTGLTDGDGYTFTVTETTSIGTSADSAASSTATPDALPGTPTGVTGAAGNDEVEVSFDAPAGPYTSLLVTATDTTASSHGGQTAFGTSSPIDVTGLTNGDDYTFTVTAYDGTVAGTPSTPSATVSPDGPPNLTMTGSSLAAIALTQWVGASSVLYGLNIDFQVSSSVIGLDNFAQNQVDLAASDFPYSAGQSTYYPDQPYQYVPDVGYGLAFPFHLDGTDGQPVTDLRLDAAVIDDIFLGRITSWDDPSITALNPQLAGDLPSTRIIPVYRTDGSGENELLTSYLLAEDGATFTAAQDAFGSGDPGQPSAAWPTPAPSALLTDYPGWMYGNLIGQSGADNVADYVASPDVDGAITYVAPAYAAEHDLPVASVENASGNFVQPTSTDVSTALGAAAVNPDLTADLGPVFDDPSAAAYPLSGYSYLVAPCSPGLASAQGSSCQGPDVPSSLPDAAGAEVGQFIQFLACAGQDSMSAMGFAPLPANLVQEDFDAIGRLDGATEPAPPTAADCSNPALGG